MFSLTWRKQQTSRWPALGQNNCKDCSTLFPSQSCLRSFVLPSGIFLPMISSDVWRYFGISPLSLEIFQSTSLEWLLWSAAFASATEISHPVQLPQVPCSTLSGRQQSTVRLILNDKRAVLLISMQTKRCQTTLKTAQPVKSKDTPKIKSVSSRWEKKKKKKRWRRDESTSNKMVRPGILPLSYFSVHASFIFWNQFQLHLNKIWSNVL